MRLLLIGLTIGTLLTAGALVTLSAVAQGDDPNEQRYHPVGLFNEVNRLVNMACDVSIGRGRANASGQCFRDEVMVGARDGLIMCADVYVDCFSKD